MSVGGIDRLLERAVDDRVVPGVIAVAGNRDGVLYEGAFGALDINGDAPARPDTTFALASMTKAFTCAAALQLIEQGGLELEQPVADVLPALPTCRCWRASMATRPGCGRRRAKRRFATCSPTLQAWVTGSVTPTCCAITNSPGPPTRSAASWRRSRRR